MADPEQRSEPEAPARLTVRRDPPGGPGDQYPISVSLDGRRLQWLRPGESASVELPAGSHRVSVFNTLMRKSAEIDARPGEEIRFRTTSRTGFGSGILAAFGTGLLYPVLEREERATSG